MKNDGGPAFPQPDENLVGKIIAGMSLRDWFAGMALQGMCSQPENQQLSDGKLAIYSYSIADSMIEERMKNNESR